MGRALLLGVAEVLGRLDVLAGRRLIAVADVRRLPSGSWLIERYELTGETARRLESLERPESDAARLPRPQRLYLHAPETAPDTEAAPAWSLHPLLLYDHDTAELFFLNARRGKRRIEYLGYHSGRSVERTDLDAEQRELLVRVLGIEVGAAEVERWAARSQAEEPPLALPPADAPQPRRMGEFELLSELGRGGMGIVYRAWQPSLGRHVALKSLLRPGDPKAEARFHREIHALGRVEHPNLVKVYTSGAAADQWFYAMELVDGATLGAVCGKLQTLGSGASDIDLATWHATLSTACQEARAAEKPLSAPSGDEGRISADRPASATSPAGGRDYVRHVVELVRQAAEAAHALHEAGVIHRDIKPDNILVTPDGTQAVLMDLGLAQLADDAEGRLTRTRQFVGTLRYASREQILSAPLDRRTDIYSLGATLWELLTLRLLFGVTDQTPTPQLILDIQNADPQRPRHLNPRVPDDLEAIVLKCLEKDRSRRYATASDLAADLSRWLRGEPVQAQPLTFRYWASKLARRHRGPLAAAAGLLALVASGAVFEITRSNLANRNLKSALTQVAEQKTRAETANKELRLALSEVEAQKKKAEAALIQARAASAEAIAQKQKAEAAGAEATDQKQKAVAALARAEAAGAEARKEAARAEAINNFLLNDMLAQAAPEQNARARKVTVEELLDRAAGKIDQAFANQPEVQASIRETIGTTYWKLGEYAKAEPHHRSAWKSRSEMLGPEHPDTLTAINELAVVLEAQGKPGEAEPLLRQVLEARRRTQGPGHPHTLMAMGNLAVVLHDQGKLDEAEPLDRQLMEARRRTQGPEHPDTLLAINNLAMVLQAQGKLGEAEPLLRQLLEAQRRTQGLEHPDTLLAINNLALFLLDGGKPGEAVPLLRELLQARRKAMPEDELAVANTLSPLGWALTDTGHADEAEPLLREAVAIRRKKFPPGFWATASSESLLGASLTAQGRYAEAEPLLRQSVAVLLSALHVPPERVRQALGRIETLYSAWGKPEEAEVWRLKRLDFDFPADPFAP
jgi:serine/threonine protein kinase